MTTIPALSNDLERFKRLKIDRQHELGEELSHEEFLTYVLNVYEQRKKEG